MAADRAPVRDSVPGGMLIQAVSHTRRGPDREGGEKRRLIQFKRVCSEHARRADVLYTSVVGAVLQLVPVGRVSSFDRYLAAMGDIDRSFINNLLGRQQHGPAAKIF